MAEHLDPFEAYIVDVMRHLDKIPSEQQAQIADELRAHLEDAAAAHGERRDNPAVRARIVRQMGMPRHVGRALAKVHAPMNAWQYVRQITARLRKVTAGLTATASLMFFCFSLMIVPVPNSKAAVQITGTVACMSRPHPTKGDMTIVLEDGRKFYVNRADKVEYFAWERLLREVKAGDTIHLTAVQPLGERWIEPGRAGGYTPLAGIRTSSVIYMDERISAHTWRGPGSVLLMALAALLITCLFSIQEISGLLGRRTIA